MEEIRLRGASGRDYTFHSGQMGALWRPLPGLYAFARPAGLGFDPLYLGRTANFALRVPGHEAWEEAARMGATHVLASVVSRREDRVAAEEDLLAGLKPVLNWEPPAPLGKPASAQISPFPPVTPQEAAEHAAAVAGSAAILMFPRVA